MKYIYAVRDNAVEAFGTPFFLSGKGEALRSFSDEANSKNENSAIAKHPEDYDLYELGVYDEIDGSIAPHAKPEKIVRAKDTLIQRT